MADKSIRVSEEVHEKVAQVATSNFRGLGDQVAYWAANTCAHPLENRIKIAMVASVVEPATKKNVARVGKAQPYRGFFCTKCNRPIIPDFTEAINEAAEDTES